MFDLGRCAAALRADRDGRGAAVDAARNAVRRIDILRDGGADDGIGMGAGECAERDGARRQCGEDARDEPP